MQIQTHFFKTKFMSVQTQSHGLNRNTGRLDIKPIILGQIHIFEQKETKYFRTPTKPLEDLDQTSGHTNVILLCCLQVIHATKI